MQNYRDAHSAASTPQLAPLAPMSSYSFPVLRTEGMSVDATKAQAEWPAEAVVNHHDLGKGVRWALAIEGAAAMCIYAICYLCRLCL